jgi:hypothetical protein
MSNPGPQSAGDRVGQLTEGRIVHHHAGDGRCRAAIIVDATGVRSGGQYVSLAVFFAGQYDPMHTFTPGDVVFSSLAAAYDEAALTGGSWHWATSCPRSGGRWTPPGDPKP